MISILVALSKNNVIGNNNELPWHIPEDLKRAKEIMLHHPVIMGRKTYESIVAARKKMGFTKTANFLPNRTNIIVTHQKEYQPNAPVLVSHSLEEAIDIAKQQKGSDEIFIIGGGQLFTESLEKNLIDKLYLTTVYEEIEGEVFFPEIEASKWSLLSEEHNVTKEGASFSYQTLLKN